MMILFVNPESVKIKLKFNFPKPMLGEIPLYVGSTIYIATMWYLLSSILK